MPGGSGSMLRSRRCNANVKPNRVLDRPSSRGMIYENEELRLRTINISEEIEKGQNDIKKLRRENEHLRREIWALREECDRLQELLKQQVFFFRDVLDVLNKEEEEEDEDEESEEEEEVTEAVVETPKEEQPKRIIRDKLSVVPEEPEDNVSSTGSNATLLPQINENPERSVEEFKPTPPSCLRINSVHPYTAAATIDPHVLPNLSVYEVIEEVVKKCPGVVGVRLLNGSAFLSFTTKESLDSAISLGLTLRGNQLPLHDVSQGTIVIAMSGVPHHLSDTDLANFIGQFGPVISSVERRLYRDVDTGERLARIRPTATVPRRIFLQGSEIQCRPLCHDELARLSIQQSPPKSYLHLKVEAATASNDINTFNTFTPATSPTCGIRSEPFQFPETPATTINCSSPPVEEKGQSGPSGVARKTESKTPSDTESKSRLKASRRNVRRTSPSSSSEQESPNKPRRRKSSVCLPPMSFYERDKSPSLSSRVSNRRKMSTTGRETGKIPWCACWGNGCF